MSATFTFDDAKVRAFFRSIQSSLKNIKDGNNKFVALLDTVILRDLVEHFDNQMGSGGPWAKWNKAYAKNRASKGRTKILQDTGFLRNNFQPNSVRKVSGGLLWFNKTPYAGAHDEGIGQTKRDFMWLSEKAAESLAAQTLKFIEESNK